MQRFTLGAVHKQLQGFAVTDAVGPVRIGDGRATHSNQIVTVVQRLVNVCGVHNATHTHHRNLRERFGTHGVVFLDQRGWVLRIYDGWAQRCTHGEVQVIQATGGQFFQQVQRVVKTDARNFHLFRREAIADNKSVVGVLTDHFMGDVQDRQRESGAVVTAAAPLVVALVGVRGVKLLDQIGICTVNFDAVEARLNRTTNRFAKFPDHAFDFFAG
ncbi:hypothetical protein D3C72_912480 [compost metagenome]